MFLVAFFYSCFQLLLVTANVTWTCSEHKCLTSRQHRPIFVLLHHYYIHKFPRWNNPHASWRGCGSAYRDSLEIIEQNYYVSWCFQKYSRKIPVLSGNPLVILSKPHQGILHPLLNQLTVKRLTTMINQWQEKNQSNKVVLPCSEGTDTTRDAEMQIWHTCAPRTVKTLVPHRTLAKIISLCSIHGIQLDNPVCYAAQILMLPSASLIGSQAEVSTTLVGAGKSVNFRGQAAAFLNLSIMNT